MIPTVINVVAASIGPDGQRVLIEPPADSGPPGHPGWTPMLRGVSDGVRTLVEIYNWTGGTDPKPATGYLTEGGGLTESKAAGFNFNRSKRIESYSAVTRATGASVSGVTLAAGEQMIEFTTAFPAPPRVVPTGRANLAGRPVVVEEVTTTTTYTIVRASRSKATLANLLTSLFDLIGGVTINVLVIEA